MKKVNSNVSCAGMDVHYKFSNVTFRDASGKVVSRQRLDHPDRQRLQERLGEYWGRILNINYWHFFRKGRILGSHLKY